MWKYNDENQEYFTSISQNYQNQKITLIQYYYLIYRPYLNFARGPKNVLYRNLFSSDPGSHISFNFHASLVSFKLELFLIPSLSFMTLIFFKSTSHLFHSMTSDLSLSDASLRLDSGYPGYEVYPFYCSSAGGTQHRFVTLLICKGDGIKKKAF